MMKHYSFHVTLRDRAAYDAFHELLEKRHAHNRWNIDEQLNASHSENAGPIEFFLNIALDKADRAPWERTVQLWEEMGFHYTASLSNYSEDDPIRLPKKSD